MRALLALLCGVTIAACGRGEPVHPVAPPGAESRPTETDRTSRTTADPAEPAHPGHAASGMSVEGEVGGLDQDAVNGVMKTADRAIDRCWQRGADRNELLAGTIDLVLGVGEAGRLVYGYARQSTLGDRATERCMLDALRAQTWPKPVGGKVGVVRTSLAFDLGRDTRPPTSWSSAQAGDAVARAAGEIAACKHGAGGTFTATVYVKQVELPPPDAGADDAGDAGDAGPSYAGSAISVGIAVPDDRGEAIADCLVRVLSAATYPPPGDWPAKLTFSL